MSGEFGKAGTSCRFGEGASPRDAVEGAPARHPAPVRLLSVRPLSVRPLSVRPLSVTIPPTQFWAVQLRTADVWSMEGVEILAGIAAAHALPQAV
jgi:hypothetical protein